MTPASRGDPGRRLSESEPLAFPLDGNLADGQRLRRIEKYGWLGRYFDNACAGGDPTVGVSIGRQMPQAFFAQKPKGISFNNPQSYRFLSTARQPAWAAEMTEESYRKAERRRKPVPLTRRQFRRQHRRAIGGRMPPRAAGD